MADPAAPPPPPAGGGQQPGAAAENDVDIPNLDTALLETLFYNEMLLMDDPTHTFDMSAILDGRCRLGLGSAGCSEAEDSVGDSTFTTDGGSYANSSFKTPAATAPLTPAAAARGGEVPEVLLPSLSEATAAANLGPSSPLAPQSPSGAPSEPPLEQIDVHAASMATALPPAYVAPPPMPGLAPTTMEPPVISGGGLPALAARAMLTRAQQDHRTQQWEQGELTEQLVQQLQGSGVGVGAGRRLPGHEPSQAPRGESLSRPRDAVLPPPAPTAVTIAPTMVPPAPAPATAPLTPILAAAAVPLAPAPSYQPISPVSRPVAVCRPRTALETPPSSTATPAAPSNLPPPREDRQPSSTAATQIILPQQLHLPPPPIQTLQPPARSVPPSSLTRAERQFPAMAAPPLFSPQPLGARAPEDQSKPHGGVQQPQSQPTAGVRAEAVPPEQAQQATQLVTQFATLASHLGISLPPQVLASLTAAAQQKLQLGVYLPQVADPPSPRAVPPAAAAGQLLPPPAQAWRSPVADAATPAADLTAPIVSAAAALPCTDSLARIRDTAEEAIAAVETVRKRSASASAEEDHRHAATTVAFSEEHQPSDVAAVHAHGGVKSSAQYRRRKKPRLEDCETRLQSLRAENETLRRHLSNVQDKTQRFDAERHRQEMEMRELVRSAQEGRVGGDDIKETVAKFSEMYSDYGRQRQDEVRFHLDQLERLAVPTTFTKMTLWTMGQGDQFFLRPKSHPIAGILMRELGITSQQGRKIIEHRDRIKKVCVNIRQCLELLGKLKGLCGHKQRLFHDRMTKCQEILTPLQVVKLLLWVDEHQGVLETACPGWGSERIRGSNKKSATASDLTGGAALAEENIIGDGRSEDTSADLGGAAPG